jgi:hypothetical protein
MERKMVMYENMKQFAGKPVTTFQKAGDITDFAATAPRVRCEYDEPMTLRDYLSILFDQPGVEATTALVIGLWMENGEAFDVTPQPALEMMVAMKDKLPNLNALFIGDIVSEENELSWIGNCDHSAIWGAFPKLETYTARGGNGLRLGKINHRALKSLTLETGGMAPPLLHEALQANAPLQHLELWLGDENYGANTSVADLQNLFSGDLFPELEYLGLKNSQYSDDIAEAIAKSPLLDRIKFLDLSMGTLTDKGALALAASGKLDNLSGLDVSHHYMTEKGMAALKGAVKNVVMQEQNEPDDWGDGEMHYYVAVGE